MSNFDRVERHLPQLMADLASARVPDYFDDLLRETARTRQRPAWRSRERWLPLDLTFAPVSNRTRSLAGIAVLAIVGLLAAATLLVYVGSHQQRLPAPFGPAGNGSWYYSAANGDIYATDPLTGASRLILAGAQAGPQPAPSRDGRLIEFGRKVTGGDQILVAGADGSNVRTLPGTFAGFAEVDWSPDSTHLAIVSTVGGVASLSVLPVDGSTSKSLPLGLEVHDIWYLADGRIAFQGIKSEAGSLTYGLYVVNADGTGLRSVEPPTSGPTDWLALDPSPDGRSLVYHRWRDPGETGRLHIVDIETGKDTPVQVDGAVDGEHHEIPQYSPDGTQILFTRFEAGSGDAQVSVLPVGGGAATLLGPAVPSYQPAPTASYSPDGRNVIAYYPSLGELWLLDPTGGKAGGDRKLSLPVTEAPTWQRLAP